MQDTTERQIPHYHDLFAQEGGRIEALQRRLHELRASAQEAQGRLDSARALIKEAPDYEAIKRELAQAIQLLEVMPKVRACLRSSAANTWFHT